MKAAAERFMAKVQMIPIAGCWIWVGAEHVTGYGRFGMPGGRVEFAHRASYQLFCGEIPRGIYVCHTCDVRMCVNPHHLFLGTASDNMKDASRKGRIKLPRADQMLRGQMQPMSKLTNDQVRAIRASGETNNSLAAKYGVDPSAISLVKNRKTYRSVE